ncbi:hypothetical protein JCM10212_003027 [Sporobolomyces blumeae]
MPTHPYEPLSGSASTHKSPQSRKYHLCALALACVVVIPLLHRLARAVGKHPSPSPARSDPARPYPSKSASSMTNVPRPNGKVNVGYFTNWGIYGRGYKPEHIPVGNLTHLLYCFANLKEDGEVHLTDSWSDQEIHYANDSWNDPDVSTNLYGNLKQLYLLKKRNRNLKVLLSIGGWTYSEHGKFARGVDDDHKRAKFVESAVRIVEDYGLDGLDIDWEYPENPKQAQDYVLLLRDLRQGLDRLAASKGLQLPAGFELTIAAPCGPSTFEKLDVRGMDPYLSFWNLMAYDYAGSWDSTANHQANLFGASPQALSSDRAIRFYTSKGVSVDKLVLGIPLYGRSFMHCQGPGTPFQGVGKGSWEAGSYDYKALPLPGSQETYDPHLVAASCFAASTGEFVTYDTQSSAVAKAEFIAVNGLRGAMYWELSGDKPRTDGGIVGAVRDVLDSKGGGLDSRENCLDYSGSKWSNLRSGMQGE